MTPDRLSDLKKWRGRLNTANYGQIEAPIQYRQAMDIIAQMTGLPINRAMIMSQYLYYTEPAISP
jgi:hypothetical protein